jgi:hypothetical protein
MRWMPLFLQMSPLLFVSVVFSGCSTAPSGPEKFPVRGSVQINGSPAVQVAVTLHHTDPAVQGNLRYATGVTGADGRFELSSEGDRDGAVAGEYRVSMAWMSSPELDAFDMLQSAYSDPAKTGIVARVPAADGELPPFVLSVPEEKIRRPGDRQKRPPVIQ